MGLFVTNDNTVTGNSMMVGDMLITWDDGKEPESEAEDSIPQNFPEAQMK
jgi:hypothetical protein